jgi:hypothetical protein
VMCELIVYAITPQLWRWEIRRGGALLRCGTAPTRFVATIEGKCVIDSGSVTRGN